MLFILFACESNSLLKMNEPTIEQSPMEAYVELETSIAQAFELWSENQSDQSKRLLNQIYQEDFQKWHAQIAKEDPKSSMELELQFGKTLQAMGNNDTKNAKQFQQSILKLLKREMSELPYTPPEVQEPAVENEITAPSDGTSEKSKIVH